MKKIFFLLLMAVALVGLMPAQEVAYNPPDLMADMVLAEYSVQESAVTQPTVLVLVAPDMALPTISIQTVMAYNDNFIATPSQYGVITSRVSLERFYTTNKNTSFFLRC